jgi:hypothetical protein
MPGQPFRYSTRAAAGLIAALAIGLMVVLACNTVFAITGRLAVGEIWAEESPAQLAAASLPYLTLAACGVSARRAWITALCLTAAFWGYYFWSIARYQGGGADIGLGILMLFSPIPITGGSMFALVAFAERRKQAA